MTSKAFPLGGDQLWFPLQYWWQIKCRHHRLWLNKNNTNKTTCITKRSGMRSYMALPALNQVHSSASAETHSPCRSLCTQHTLLGEFQQGFLVSYQTWQVVSSSEMMITVFETNWHSSCYILASLWQNITAKSSQLKKAVKRHKHQMMPPHISRQCLINSVSGVLVMQA